MASRAVAMPMPAERTTPPPALPDLSGRVALITGGSRGIGLAVACAFARAGCRIALIARDSRALEEARARIEALGSEVVTIPGSVADHEFCARAVDRVENAWGRVDVLVNNAGIQGPIGPLEELEPRAIEETLSIDLLGPAWMMRATLPAMKRRRSGVILNLSGGGATGVRENFAPYAMAKTALVRLTEIAAAEARPFGVRINAVAPGAVNTRMTEEVERSGARAGPRAVEETRVQRETGGTDPNLAASMMVWLASDAASHITGRLISALWDDWQALLERSAYALPPDWFTLRRVTPPAEAIPRVADTAR